MHNLTIAIFRHSQTKENLKARYIYLAFSFYKYINRNLFKMDKTGFKFNSTYNHKNYPIDFDDVKVSNPESLNVEKINKDFKKFIDKKDFENVLKYIDLYGTKIIYERYICVDKDETRKMVNDLIGQYGPNLNLNWIDMSNMTDLSSFFSTYVELEKNGINTFTAALINLKIFNGDISEWNMSNVTNLAGMFMDTVFNGDISKWDTSNVKDMSFMFSDAKFNNDISNWDISKVSEMQYMFSGAEFNQDISKWNVSNVKDMSHMFNYSKFNQNISNWNISDKCNKQFMFNHSSINKHNKPLVMLSEQIKTGFKFSSNKINDIDFDDSKITITNSLNKNILNREFKQFIDDEDYVNAQKYVEIYGTNILHEKLSIFSNYTLWKIIDQLVKEIGPNINLNWIDVSKMTNFSHLFSNSIFNGDISNWDVSNANDMSYMFYHSSFNGNISKWNVSNVKNMSHIFESSKFNQDISQWRISSICTVNDIFLNASIIDDYKFSLNLN